MGSPLPPHCPLRDCPALAMQTTYFFGAASPRVQVSLLSCVQEVGSKLTTLGAPGGLCLLCHSYPLQSRVSSLLCELPEKKH